MVQCIPIRKILQSIPLAHVDRGPQHAGLKNNMMAAIEIPSALLPPLWSLSLSQLSPVLDEATKFSAARGSANFHLLTDFLLVYMLWNPSAKFAGHQTELSPLTCLGDISAKD